MSKKIKLSLPRYVVEILETDRKYFSLPKDAICNNIIMSLGFNQRRKIEISILDKKASISFNLNNKNFSLFYEMLKISNMEVENEFTRMLMIEYANMHPSLREKVLNLYLFRDLELCVKNKKMIKILHEKQIIDVIPIYFERDKITLYNTLKIKSNNQEKIIKIKDIEILKIY